MIKAALLGNPNVGKTTLFNALTGSNQYVGNWPGVTVDKREGFFEDITIVDLPGIYAMDTFSNEEKVSKNFLMNSRVDVILNIVDGTNLNRNLYLTIQLKQFNKPIILILNMIDLCDKKGIIIDYKVLEDELGVQVIPISAGKNRGIEKIKEVLKNKKYMKAKDIDLYNFKNEKQTYAFIEKVINKAVTVKYKEKKSLTDNIDRYVLHPVLSFPIFISIMILMFKITFSWIGQPLSDLMSHMLSNDIIPLLSKLLSKNSEWFRSLILEGIVGGVGGIVVLLPIILVLFICITILEDSGYMARIAFMMDKLMRKMGLSGKAFIPMIIGFGCSVPAIMSARTLESEKDRKLTALLVPFMSCNARLPVYVIFASVFFKGHEGIVMASLYIMGITIAFMCGGLISGTVLKKEEEPFLLEIPEYKIPKFSSVLNITADKAIDFLGKAGTLIFAMSVLIWGLSNFNFSGAVCEVNESMLASIGSRISIIFKPLGFGSWQSSVSLLSGLMAKETVISSMQVIFKGNLNTVLVKYFNILTAYSFMSFVLLYTPCISTVGTMKKEYGIKFTVISIIFQFVVAWSVSFCIFNIGSLIIQCLC